MYHTLDHSTTSDTWATARQVGKCLPPSDFKVMTSYSVFTKKPKIFRAPLVMTSYAMLQKNLKFSLASLALAVNSSETTSMSRLSTKYFPLAFGNLSKLRVCHILTTFISV